MWEFLDRLITIALPRVRDFRGVPPKSFDGRGNYTLGVRDQLIFPEIDYNKVEKTKGMNITIVTTAGNDERALSLLQRAGHAVRSQLRRIAVATQAKIVKTKEAEVHDRGTATAARCAAGRAASCASSALPHLFPQCWRSQGISPA